MIFLGDIEKITLLGDIEYTVKIIESKKYFCLNELEIEFWRDLKQSLLKNSIGARSYATKRKAGKKRFFFRYVIVGGNGPLKLIH